SASDWQSHQFLAEVVLVESNGSSLENEKLFQPAPLVGGVPGSLAMYKGKTPRAKEGEKFGEGHGKGRAARLAAQGKGEVNVSPAGFQQARYQVGIVSAPCRVNGAKTSIFEDVVKALVECVG